MTTVRAAYTALAFIAMPFAALYLLWRSRRQPEYRLHWAERFGFARYAQNIERPLIWIHAVSLGETRAAEPLIDALAARFPRHQFLLTHMTPTGRAAGATSPRACRAACGRRICRTTCHMRCDASCARFGLR